MGVEHCDIRRNSLSGLVDDLYANYGVVPVTYEYTGDGVVDIDIDLSSTGIAETNPSDLVGIAMAIGQYLEYCYNECKDTNYNPYKLNDSNDFYFDFEWITYRVRFLNG